MFGNFSADPLEWPPTHPPAVHDVENVVHIIHRVLTEDGLGVLNEDGVEFRHLVSFDPGRRFGGTLILWRAFEAFYAPILHAASFRHRHSEYWPNWPLVRARRVIVDLHDRQVITTSGEILGT